MAQEQVLRKEHRGVEYLSEPIALPKGGIEVGHRTSEARA